MKTAIQTAIERCNPPTQAELARVTGFRPQVVSRWTKRGWVTARHALRIAEVTGVPIHAFLADELRNAGR